MNDIIRQRVDAFVEDLSDLIRRAAFEAVHQALGAGTAAPSRRTAAGRPKKAARKTGGRKKAARKTRGVLAADAERHSSSLMQQIRRQPGLRLEELAGALDTTTMQLRPALDQLLQQGRVRTQGMARGMRYLPGKGSVAKKAGSKKKARKKAATRKKKKVARKKKTTRRVTKAGAQA